MIRCDQCRFFHPHPPASELGELVVAADGIRGGGECRANPPVLINDETLSAFPAVWNDAWCGWFEMRHADVSQHLIT